MEEMLISVIMPAYNSEKYIAKSIESILSQTYKNFELIIIDDCATDRTAEIIDIYCKKDNRIKKITNEKNSGVAYSRNQGVFQSLGDWIAFCDSDDVWEEAKLQKQVELLKKNNKEPLLIYTGSSFIDDGDDKYDYIMQVPERVIYRELLKQNVISCSSVLVKKEVLENIKMKHDEIHEDFLSWLRILKKYDACAYGINEPLLKYRLTKNSKSRNKIKAAKMTYMVYKKIGLNFFERIYYMSCYIRRSLNKYGKIK